MEFGKRLRVKTLSLSTLFEQKVFDVLFKYVFSRHTLFWKESYKISYKKGMRLTENSMDIDKNRNDFL